MFVSPHVETTAGLHFGFRIDFPFMMCKKKKVCLYENSLQRLDGAILNVVRSGQEFSFSGTDFHEAQKLNTQK